MRDLRTLFEGLRRRVVAWRGALRVIAAFAVVLTAFAPFRAGAAEAVSARIDVARAETIVELALSEPMPFRLFTLEDPRRVVVDLPPLAWRAAAPDAPEASPLVSGLRFGTAQGGAGRMVIDLRAPAAVAEAFTAPGPAAAPARLIIRLRPTGAAEFAAEAGWPEGLRPATAAPLVAAPGAEDDAVVVVIDPGHGGRDIGAASGDVAEADLVLDYARALAALIDATPGFRAALTRDADTFLTLRQRVDAARALGADIFISIHADALEQGVASGSSVYTLSEEASDSEAAELAETANRADDLAGAAIEREESDVARVLVDFARRRTNERSESLAEAVVGEMRGRTPVLSGRAVQSAGFRVLKAPDVPSILVELGFLSSARDRERMLSPEGRDALVSALGDGVIDWARAQEGPRYAPAREGAEDGPAGKKAAD